MMVLNNNQINSINEVKFPDGLQKLGLKYNQITSLDGVKFPDTLQMLVLNNNQITSLDSVKFPDGLQELWLHANRIDFGIKKKGWHFNKDCYLLTQDEYKQYINIKYRVCRRFIKRLRLSIIKDMLPFHDCGKMILGFM
jgi:hypothetical protein